MYDLVHGNLTSSHLPQYIDLGNLNDEIRSLCDRSFRGSPDQWVEWGACILWKGTALKLGDKVSGFADQIVPDCTPEEHSTYVGFSHTHLPDTETGNDYPGFSALDYAGALVDGACLELVCNRAEVFALVRNHDFTEPRRKPSPAEFYSWERLYEEKIERARREMASAVRRGSVNSDALDRALYQINRKMCQNLGFAFYRGLLGEPLELIFRPSSR